MTTSVVDGLIARLLGEARIALDHNNTTVFDERILEVRALAPDHPDLDAIARRQPGELILVTDENKQLTILFCDQVGSTPFVESHGGEATTWVRRMYHALFSRAVDLNGGSVQGYSGDGLVACFGHPYAHENDAARAVDAALTMLQSLEPLRESVRTELDDEFQVRIGIHTGDVVVADLGTATAPLPNAVTGLTPNIASRLQDFAGKGEVLVSGATSGLLGPAYRLRPNGPKRLKGVSHEIDTFTVEGKSEAATLDNPRLGLSPLVGRSEEIEQLEALWRGTTINQPGASVLLDGQAGLGKTRLLKYVRDFSFAEGGQAVMTSGNELEVSQPFRYIARAVLLDLALAWEAPDLALRVEQLLLDHGLSAIHAQALASLFPSPDVSGRLALDPTELRQRITEALTRWITLRGRTRRTCLLCDDLQWADASSRSWLASLVADVPSGIMVAAGSRAPEADFGLRLTLRALPVETARALVANLVGDDAGLTDTIVEHADGVPLFLEELSQSPGPSMPRSLKEVVQAELEPEPARRVAQLLATIGRIVPSQTLARIGPSMGSSEQELQEQTQELLARGIIEYDSPGAYRFRHHLVWQAAYDTQSGPLRLSRHAVLANALAAEHEANADLAGRHFLQAEMYVEACTQMLAACAQSQDIGAHAEALEQLSIVEQCLARVDEMTAPVFVAGLCMRRALSNASTVGYADDRVCEDFEQATGLARQLVHVPELQQLLVPALMGMWSYYAVHGDMSTSGPIVNDLLGLELDADSAVVARSIGGMDQLFRGDVTAAIEAFDTIDEQLDDAVIPFGWPLPNDPFVGGLAIASATARLRGHDQRANELLDRAFTRSQASAFPMGPVSMAFTHAYAALAHGLLGNHDRQAHHGGAAMAIGRHHGFAEWTTLGQIHTIVGRALLGESGLSKELADAVALWRSTGAGLFIPILLGFQAKVAHDEGDVAAAAAFVSEGLISIASTGQELAHSQLLAVQAALADSAADSRRLVSEATMVASLQGADALASSFANVERSTQ